MARNKKEKRTSATVGKKIEQSRYKPLRNKQRQYRDTKTGKIISRRQYTKAVYTGGKSLEKRAKELRAAGVKSHVARYSTLLKERQEFLKAQGIKKSLGEIRQSADMKNLVRDLRSRDNSARGKKARALVQLGLRDESWNWAVGETPTT